MILDGYNKIICLKADDGVRVIEYRPALSHEREDLFLRVSQQTDPVKAQNLYGQEILDRVQNPEEAIELPPNVQGRLLRAVLGQDFNTEKEDAQNLSSGLRFQMEYPGLSRLDCETCKKWWVDPITGKFTERKGKLVERPDYATLLCETREGCPKGTPEKQKGLSAKNRKALRHYLECRAVGSFPDDAIVKQNARIISQVLADANQRILYTV